jgi:hypothetical protein
VGQPRLIGLLSLGFCPVEAGLLKAAGFGKLSAGPKHSSVIARRLDSA